MLRSDSDTSSLVTSILEGFKRKASPNRLEVDEVNRNASSVSTRLNFDNESFENYHNEPAKKKKWSLDGTASPSNVSHLDASTAGEGFNSMFISLVGVNLCASHKSL